jgi:hypothetical protein
MQVVRSLCQDPTKNYNNSQQYSSVQNHNQKSEKAVLLRIYCCFLLACTRVMTSLAAAVSTAFLRRFAHSTHTLFFAFFPSLHALNSSRVIKRTPSPTVRILSFCTRFLLYDLRCVAASFAASISAMCFCNNTDLSTIN